MKVLRRHPVEVVGLVLFTVVSVVLTLIIGNTLARTGSGDVQHYTARFTDASGIEVGDDVRIAGVRVGRVESRELDGSVAAVQFSVDRDQQVRTDTTIRVSFLNLLGQRYLSLEAGTTAGRPLRDGAIIDTDRTLPALDLTELFNAFKPLFDALDPKDVNLIATELVETLQGQGPRIAHLMEQTASLTNHLAERDEVITRVIDNVTLVMEQTSEHRDELRAVVSGLDGLVGQLADDRGDIDTAVQSMDRLAVAFDGLLDESATPLGDALESFAGLGEVLVAHRTDLDTGLRDAPALMDGYSRALSFGSWLNTYVCTLDLSVEGVKVPDVPGGRSEVCR